MSSSIVPFWKPLPTTIDRNDSTRLHQNENDDDDDDDVQEKEEQQLLTSFGNREGHVSTVLESKLLICFGGWVDGEASEEVLGFDLENSTKKSSWKIVATTPIAFVSGASLSGCFLFGGMDLDSCDCRNSLFRLDLLASSAKVNFFEIKNIMNRDDDQRSPCPRHRHGATLIENGTNDINSSPSSSASCSLVIFGGENDENQALNDLWMFSFSSNNFESGFWRRIEFNNNNNSNAGISPRAACCVFSISNFLVITGGLTYLEENGDQQSLNDVYVLQLCDVAESSVAVTLISKQDDFFAMPVNCLLAAPMLDRNKYLLFGGKDSAKGNDDLLVVGIDFLNGDGETQQKYYYLRKFQTIKCPFVEAEKEDAADEAVSKLNRNYKNDSNEVDENCW
jgi:hypothetical protein